MAKIPRTRFLHLLRCSEPACVVPTWAETRVIVTSANIVTHAVMIVVTMEDGGGGHWLVQMEWRPVGWSLCLPLLIFH